MALSGEPSNLNTLVPDLVKVSALVIASPAGSTRGHCSIVLTILSQVRSLDGILASVLTVPAIMTLRSSSSDLIESVVSSPYDGARATVR